MPVIEGINVPFVPVRGVDDLRIRNRNVAQPGKISEFDELFRKELSKLKFSGHAKARMESREITLSDTEAEKLEKAVNSAEAKGAGESLVLLNDKAFIVSVANRTVITAMNREQMEASVITNIDSAVIA